MIDICRVNPSPTEKIYGVEMPEPNDKMQEDDEKEQQRIAIAEKFIQLEKVSIWNKRFYPTLKVSLRC